MKAPQERAAEVRTVSSDTKEHPVALEEVATKAVEDVAATEKIVRRRTRTKVAAATEVAAKERKSQPTEARYQALHKRLDEEVEKRRHSEQVCEGLREDVKRAKCASVDVLNRLKVCQTTYDAESLKVDELSAAVEEGARVPNRVGGEGEEADRIRSSANLRFGVNREARGAAQRTKDATVAS
ncbi:hypothetical protein AXG93_1175s1220 [Marchantia polymorpha subsp. ruderalis]|uniref:Uncharacterized protein n=1 Tax=Marchantia polymorpha subsp. ruderalis TaxID=1480154 RepID=A0A176VP80_MARPO|nr:hypothetical protein AXG93_1175s1220 [Marchantia polymorpha subsp. ruderalis]